MRDYAELIKALRFAFDQPCYSCVLGEKCNWGNFCFFKRSADAIEKLLKENGELENFGRLLMAAFARLKEKVPHWISVEERLPEIGKFVLVSDGDDIDAACRYKAFTIPDEVETFFWDSVLEVTHWMPLPKPPKEDAE